MTTIREFSQTQRGFVPGGTFYGDDDVVPRGTFH